MKLLMQIVAGLGALLLVAALVGYLQTTIFLSRARQTVGTVEALFTSSDPDTNSRFFCPRISFTTTKGQTIKFDANVCSSPAPYTEGDLVNLYYDPDDPYNAQIKSFSAQYLLPTSFIVSGLPLVIIGLVGLYLQKRRRLGESEPR